MITRNRPFSKGEAIFKDPMTTAAAIDRLVHHGVIIELNSPATGWNRLKEEDRPALSEIVYLLPGATKLGCKGVHFVKQAIRPALNMVVPAGGLRKRRPLGLHSG